MFAIPIWTWRAASVAPLVVFAIMLAASSSPARAALNPAAGPDDLPFRCCFRFNVTEVGSAGVSFEAGSPVQRGTFGGEWDWETVGIYSFLEDPHRRGELWTLAADERDSMNEVNAVDDLVYSDESYVWVPDNTNNTYGNCEYPVNKPYHRMGGSGTGVASSNIFTFGPIYEVGPDEPSGFHGVDFGCDVGNLPALSALPQFKQLGGVFSATAIPHPAYSSFASGDAIHTVTCNFSAFASGEPPGPHTDKADKSMTINIQYFPESKLGRAEKTLKAASTVDTPPGFAFGSEGAPVAFRFSATANPSTPQFESPQKNGCHNGS